MPHTFDDLVQLEQTAVTAHASLATADDHPAAWQAWRDAAVAFQAAVTAYAEAEGEVRYEVEMRAKKAVRHPETAEG